MGNLWGSWDQELQKAGEEVTSNTGFRVLAVEWIKASNARDRQTGKESRKPLSIKQWSVQSPPSGKVSGLKHLLYAACRCKWRGLCLAKPDSLRRARSARHSQLQQELHSTTPKPTELTRKLPGSPKTNPESLNYSTPLWKSAEYNSKDTMLHSSSFNTTLTLTHNRDHKQRVRTV